MITLTLFLSLSLCLSVSLSLSNTLLLSFFLSNSPHLSPLSLYFLTPRPRTPLTPTLFSRLSPPSLASALPLFDKVVGSLGGAGGAYSSLQSRAVTACSQAWRPRSSGPTAPSPAGAGSGGETEERRSATEKGRRRESGRGSERWRERGRGRRRATGSAGTRRPRRRSSRRSRTARARRFAPWSTRSPPHTPSTRRDTACQTWCPATERRTGARVSTKQVCTNRQERNTKQDLGTSHKIPPIPPCRSES